MTSLRLVKGLALVAATAATGLVFATPAYAAPTPTVAFSTALISPGEEFTYTVTTGTPVVGCAYIDGVVIDSTPFPFGESVTTPPLPYSFLEDGYPGATSFTIVLLNSTTATCPATLDLAAEDEGYFSESTMAIAPPTPAPAPAPEEPTLAKTGSESAFSLGFAALFVSAGFGALLMRRKLAR